MVVPSSKLAGSGRPKPVSRHRLRICPTADVTGSNGRGHVLHRWVFKFVLVLLLHCALLSAARAQQAERPVVRAGDQWRFVVYYGTPATIPNRTWVVAGVSPQGIEATENGEPLLLSPDLNVVESPLRRDSNTIALRFPLKVGESWVYETDTLFKDNKSTAHSVVEVRVVAHEKVRVVAGEFDAFKLSANGTFRGLSRGGPGVLEGEFTSTYWYAPAVRAVVKSVSRSPYRGVSTIELVDASLKQ